MKKLLLSLSFIICHLSFSVAQNPFVQTWFTSDPAPMVYGDKVYVYTGHDEDHADFFWMYEWRVYSSSDMVNWTDHGPLLSLASFSWADDRAWASQCIERNGKFYWYICAHSKLSGGMAVGVAVADSPTGPFKDALGKPLFDNGSWDNIDPTVFIDNDGQAWLFWGNPTINYGRLNSDMLSFDGEVKQVNQTVEGFGAPNMKERQKDVKYKDTYTEGPWILRRDVFPLTKKGKPAKKAQPLYYLLYAAGGVPEHIAYSTAPSFEGPWTYRGEIMPLEDTKFIHHTEEGVAPVGTLSPYQRIEAETMAFSLGVKAENSDAAGVFVSDIQNGDYIKVREVDFGAQSPRSFTATAASALQGGSIEVHLDSLRGQRIARLQVPRTGGWEAWQTLKADVQPAVTGKHDVYFTFRGNKGAKLMNFDWWKFER